MKKACVAALVFAALTLAVPAADTPIPVLKTYPVGFADPSNAMEVVRAALGGDGRVFFDGSTHRLMVLAPSNRHDMVAAVVKELNVPPRNVRIEVRYRGQGVNTEQEASVSGGGAVVVGQGPTRSTIRIQPRVVDSLTTVNSSTAQQILVLSGQPASIFVGENVPHLQWIMDYGYRCGLLTQQLEWQQVGATLVAEPFVIGDGPAIRLRLTPELSGRVNGDPYHTRFTTVATEVVVTDGVPFTLGGLNENKEFYSRFLVGRSRSGSSQNLDIELTVHIVPVEGGR